MAHYRHDVIGVQLVLLPLHNVRLHNLNAIQRLDAPLVVLA